MLKPRAAIPLLCIPLGLVGLIDAAFAVLSITVFSDHQELKFFLPAITMLLPAMVSLPALGRLNYERISYREALLFSTMSWLIVGLLAAIPIMTITHISFTDAVFESVSAITTTGATVLTGLDQMPHSFLLYRQFLQWLGGLGIVIFVVSVLPMLNAGGMRLLKAETPGPVKGEKLTPRLVNTTHYIWVVYVLITLMCALAYWFAGMTPYDAIAHSLSTVSTGGFSTHDASLGYFHSPAILTVADVFMLIGAISFTLHFRAMHKRNIGLYWQDEETRWFLVMVVIFSLVASMPLIASHSKSEALHELSMATFHLISFMTSTGFGATDFQVWPSMTIFLLILTGYLGGCAGSTAGGNKIIRFLLMCKMFSQEHRRLIHPKGVFPIKYQKYVVGDDVLNATAAFITFSIVSTLVLTMLVCATGLDVWSSFTAVAACLNVIGPAFGELGSNFQPVSPVGTWILSGTMLLGRLEYFTVLALFLPAFWREF
ncbi:Trk system potassium uptake protein TrkH [BD1-7 clade bacterium]|uniref:Trk system potassium uptake protein n=1 Tax=BD1-7 clade bacterium TaxID=2029982 RepID=A0A5S9QX07_9GAMM|nr:Trk system potassium uptake protein TrkH [BD1-7 clade bacterium]